MQYKVKKKARAMNCFPLPVWTGLLSLFEQEWKPFRNPAKHYLILMLLSSNVIHSQFEKMETA